MKNTIVELDKYTFLAACELGNYVDMLSTLNELNVIALMGSMNPYSGFPTEPVVSEYAMIVLGSQAWYTLEHVIY